jgi:rhamnulokinase
VSVLAFDLGASGGKALIGKLVDAKLVTTEIYRFSNDPVQVGSHLHWDILRLLHEIKQGLLKAKQLGFEFESIAIDSWAVDFGLLGKNGEMLANPYHYRDHHTEGAMAQVRAFISDEELFSRTGIQFLPFNTIYQLYAMKQQPHSILQHADALLMVPDLLRYFLTGQKASEFTNASTTQLLNPQTQDWDTELMEILGIPTRLFVKPVQPGTLTGTLLPAVREELGLPDIPVIAVGEHDTASAVAAVPTEEKHFAYLSCGTWSLMGTEIDKPVLDRQALEWNFTNEGGMDNTFRLLKNIMGLWLLQECKRAWEKEGNHLSYEELINEAKQTQPFRSIIDPDHAMFLNPLHMPKQIQQYCRETGQPLPQQIGEFVRCVIESLALKYNFVLNRTEKLSGNSFAGLNMVGGGIQNEMLCQYTANAISRPVWAGPVEASAIGNIVTQFIALGQIKTLQQARTIIKNSFPIKTYEPEASEAWSQAYERFLEITGYQHH